jgi:hypothetical protein
MKKLSLPELFHDPKGGFWLPLANGRFLNLDKRDVSIHMRQAGLNPDEQMGPLTAIERVYYVAQTEKSVDYAGPLCGHPTGSFTTTDGKRILVTSQAKIPMKEKNSDCPFYETFLNELFGPEQVQYVLLWLKCGRAAFLEGNFAPGQMLVLAGPSACGKSLFQAIVTEFFGGRVGKPYRYMVGETAFNSDVCAAEHWMIEDENASTDIRTRRKFGASLKEATVNREISLHAKGREAITLPLFRRLTLSVNDEPENLMILPPLDNSILDKVMLFQCYRANVGSDRAATWQRIVKEMPAFVRKIEAMRIPKDLACSRFGVAAYHSPSLLELLNELAPETRLLELIDTVLADEFRNNGDWQGSSDDLEQRLRASEFKFAVDRLLHYSSACGVYLQRLQVKNPRRFEAKKINGKNRWTVRKAS